MAKKKDHIIRFEDVRDRVITLRGQNVILDFAVADLYGVETREINQAVKNNPKKFPQGWIFELTKEESADLRSKIMVADAPDNQETKALKSKNLMLEDENGRGKYSKHNYKAFTERGLYMLATILKGDQAVETTLTIVDTFAKLHELKRTIAQMAQSPDEYQQKSLMHKGGEIIDDLFGDNFSTNETETEIELNFAVLKLKHTIKRKKQE